jgi:hypothetical protein
MTAQEIDNALFKEEMALDAYFHDPSPANQRSWDEARVLVDIAVQRGA